MFFEIIQSISNPEIPIMLNSIGGSLTSWDGLNPMVSVVDLDVETLLPLNIHVYSFDLANANTVGFPEWEHTFDYKQEYGLKDLSPVSMRELSQRFLSEP